MLYFYFTEVSRMQMLEWIVFFLEPAPVSALSEEKWLGNSHSFICYSQATHFHETHLERHCDLQVKILANCSNVFSNICHHKKTITNSRGYQSVYFDSLSQSTVILTLATFERRPGRSPFRPYLMVASIADECRAGPSWQLLLDWTILLSKPEPLFINSCRNE